MDADATSGGSRRSTSESGITPPFWRAFHAGVFSWRDRTRGLLKAPRPVRGMSQCRELPAELRRASSESATISSAIAIIPTSRALDTSPALYGSAKSMSSR